MTKDIGEQPDRVDSVWGEHWKNKGEKSKKTGQKRRETHPSGPVFMDDVVDRNM